jgi:hypothetical protein
VSDKENESKSFDVLFLRSSLFDYRFFFMKEKKRRSKWVGLDKQQWKNKKIKCYCEHMPV